MKFKLIALLLAISAPAAASAQTLTTTTEPRATVVVFASFDCPYCMQSQALLAAMARKYAGDLAIQFKHFPLAANDAARLPHEAALAAAAQGRFAAMHDRLFAPGQRHDRAGVEAIARELDLDLPRFRHDLDTHAWRSRIDDDVREAQGFGVKVTPTFFVQGYKFEGLQTLATFEPLIDFALGRKASRSGAAAIGPAR